MNTTARTHTAYIEGADPSEAEELAQSRSIRSVYVYEAPVRIWHWVNALAITLLCVTGYLIGSPLPSVTGEASAHYLMGYIRFVHFASAYMFAVGLLGRVYWAFAGNHHARELFSFPLLQKSYWNETYLMVKWYLFLAPRPGQYVGHNPVARAAMVFVFVPTAFFMALTGFALYGEGLQAGSWADRLFGWVIPLMGQSQDVHTFHHLGMWVLISFVMLHVYAAIREDIMGRQSIVSTMISGHRTFKD